MPPDDSNFDELRQWILQKIDPQVRNQDFADEGIGQEAEQRLEVEAEQRLEVEAEQRLEVEAEQRLEVEAEQRPEDRIDAVTGEKGVEDRKVTQDYPESTELERLLNEQNQDRRQQVLELQNLIKNLIKEAGRKLSEYEQQNQQQHRLIGRLYKENQELTQQPERNEAPTEENQELRLQVQQLQAVIDATQKQAEERELSLQGEIQELSQQIAGLEAGIEAACYIMLQLWHEVVRMPKRGPDTEPSQSLQQEIARYKVSERSQPSPVLKAFAAAEVIPVFEAVIQKLHEEYDMLAEKEERQRNRVKEAVARNRQKKLEEDAQGYHQREAQRMRESRARKKKE